MPPSFLQSLSLMASHVLSNYEHYLHLIYWVCRQLQRLKAWKAGRGAERLRLRLSSSIFLLTPLAQTGFFGIMLGSSDVYLRTCSSQNAVAHCENRTRWEKTQLRAECSPFFVKIILQKGSGTFLFQQFTWGAFIEVQIFFDLENKGMSSISID